MRISTSIIASIRGVLPSGPTRTHRFPVGNIFSHWIVCCTYDMPFPLLSRSKTSLFPFFTIWITDYRAFHHSGNLKGHRSSLLTVQCANIQFSLSFIMHCATIGSCVKNHWLLNRRTLTMDGLSANLWASRFLQLLNRQPEVLATAPKCFVEARIGP